MGEMYKSVACDSDDGTEQYNGVKAFGFGG